MLYKIVAKVIANCLKTTIGKCIDNVQSTFVPKRLISDNVLLAYEVLHTFHKKRGEKKGFMAIKLDMSKTYDRVEWNFIQEMMIQMGFNEGWVTTLMRFVSTVSYSVIINRCAGPIFHPNRGL